MENKEKNRAFALPFLLAAICCIPGCIEVKEPILNSEPFAERELQQCLCIVIDLSGSFTAQWGDQAYPFFCFVTEKYFRGALGSECRLMIGQLSGNKQTMLWEGHPSELRKAFPNAKAFNEFLLSAASEKETKSSPVFRSIANAIEYVEGTPNVTERTRVMTMVLSDLYEYGSTSAERKRDSHRMLDAVKRYTDDGGGLGLYFVRQDVRPRWIKEFAKKGIGEKLYVIETDLVSRPRIPEFD